LVPTVAGHRLDRCHVGCGHLLSDLLGGLHRCALADRLIHGQGQLVDQLLLGSVLRLGRSDGVGVVAGAVGQPPQHPAGDEQNQQEDDDEATPQVLLAKLEILLGLGRGGVEHLIKGRRWDFS
jgi:hypothetical protein